MNDRIDKQIIASLVAVDKRSDVVNDIFGLSWSLAVEPAIYQVADMLSNAPIRNNPDRGRNVLFRTCLLYTSDAADDASSV